MGDLLYKPVYFGIVLFGHYLDEMLVLVEGILLRASFVYPQFVVWDDEGVSFTSPTETDDDPLRPQFQAAGAGSFVEHQQVVNLKAGGSNRNVLKMCSRYPFPLLQGKRFPNLVIDQLPFF